MKKDEKRKKEARVRKRYIYNVHKEISGYLRYQNR